MITIKATLTTTAADRADKIVRNTAGLLREIIEQNSLPKIEALADSTVRVEPPQSTSFFQFGSVASRKHYFGLLYSGAIPYKEVGGRRVYARQGILSRAWQVRIDTRLRGANGGIVTLENRAQDVLGRVYPQFVYNRVEGSNSQFQQQPGHFNWNKDFTNVQRQMNRIVANDINRVFRRKFKGK